jgi:hypothetical protein
MLPDTQRIYLRKAALAASGLLLLWADLSLAQSGRRAPKPQQSTSTVTPTKNENAEADATKAGPRELTHKVHLIVARQPTSKHMASEDAIFASFMKRLNELTNVTGTPAGDLNRDRAVKRAKSETESFVVLLKYDIDSFQNGTIILNSPDLDVRVLAFEPVTGQEKFKGKVYYKAVGGPMMKKDNWPNGTPIKITTEAVGIEAAEQLHDWLYLEGLRQKP